MIARALACVALTAWLGPGAEAREYRYSDAHLRISVNVTERFANT
ncbi:hypothetical protein [Pseudomonas sp. LP_4_YM]|nr:hypothetical protein [Pseudomonas sp. LP_4_YM]TCT91929.1 hypothetical protein EC913_12160 [Pseudomonas sp. LP_4_YM]